MAEERECANEELIVSFCDGVDIEVEVEVEEDEVFWNVILDVLVALERSVVAGVGASYDEEVEAEIKAEEEEEDEAGRW